MKFVTTKPSKQFPLFKAVLEVVAIILVFIMVNANAFIYFPQFANVGYGYFNEWENVTIIVFVILLMGYLLGADNLVGVYLAEWRNKGFLVLFLIYALASMLWTVYLPGSVYKLIFLFFSTFAGAYLAVKYGLRGMIGVFTWIAGICSVLGLIFVAFFPYGIMQNRPFVGSWVGIFWHRNHTGNIFAFFNMIFFLRLLAEQGLSRKQRILFLVFYFLSALMVFGSRSATGIIVFMILTFSVALIATWLKWHHRLKPVHYFVTGAVLLIAFLIFVTNTPFFFGLLGRSATMTGRTPLWQDLFNNFYLKRPFFGYGFGALWMQESFRNLMRDRHGWPYPVYFADNGFFDILLNMGIVGLILFLGMYLRLGFQSITRAVKTALWVYFFPFLVFLYIFIGNLTYSFLLEVDQFVWMLLIVMIFVTGKKSRTNI